MTEVFPDSNGIVRNVEVKVAPRYKGRGPYQSQVLYQLKRHVSNLIIIVPVEETKDKEVTSQEPQVTSQEEVSSQESQVTSQETGGGVTKMRSQ